MNYDASLPENNRTPTRQHGIALLLVLFIVGLLTIISAEFAFTTRMEMTSAMNYKEDIQGSYYALAGFQYALTEIISNYDSNYLNSDGQVGFFRNWYHNPDGVPLESQGGEEQIVNWPPIPTRTGINIKSGSFDYRIYDEEARLNLNYLDLKGKTGTKSNRDIFRQLLVETGVEDGEQADIIVDSLIDWIDTNDLHSLNGAEDEWYQQNYQEQGFSEPYPCKNGKLSTIEEMLMIRGMTPSILFGSQSVFAHAVNDDRIYQGISQFVTVYGLHRAVNPNTASPTLLRILDSENADKQIEERSNLKKSDKRMSRTFRIEVSGKANGSRVSHTLVGILRRSIRKGTIGGAEILYWNDDSPQLNSTHSESGALSESAR